MNPQNNQRGLLDFRFLSILTLSLIFIIGVAYFFYGLQPVGLKMDSLTMENEEILLRVAKGEGVKEIGARLSQLSLIKSIGVFKFYSLISGSARKFKPGVYELKKTMSVPEIVSVLTAGVKDVRVVITEGMTVADIEAVLRLAGVLNEDGFNEIKTYDYNDKFPFLVAADSWEGFLFPDTYHFKVESSAEEVILKFLNNFKEKAWPLLEKESRWYDRLILASFLEREVPSFSDRQLVAGILLKRLQENIPLQVDATIVYAKCRGKIKDCAQSSVAKSDLTIPSPYNTYQHLGFTPTPIANPGQTAIKAAVSPVNSPYWYYLSATATKETIFSKTLEEHNLNRSKYL